MLEYEDRYLFSQATLKRMLNSNNDIFSCLGEQHSSILQRLDSPWTARNGENVKKLGIKPFTGNYKNWQEFKDLFVNEINYKQISLTFRSFSI